MGFGKYRGRTYGLVARMDGQYGEWAMQEAGACAEGGGISAILEVVGVMPAINKTVMGDG